MKTKKIKLPDGSIDFISNVMNEKNMSLKDAVKEWNRKQEIEKYLKVGDIVKINRGTASDYNGKTAFIGAVLSPCGTGFDPDKSGVFSTYYLNPWDNHIQGDFIGYELEPTGKTITGEFLTHYLQNTRLRDSMREELRNAMPDSLVY